MVRVLAAGILFLALAASARAATINGTAFADRLTGTPQADGIFGYDGNDRLSGLGGSDLLLGGPGRDTLLGGPGADFVAVHADRGRDTVHCGPGRDLVNAELGDRVAADCEVVSRQLSRDLFATFSGQHETQVEPDSFSYGPTVVTAFQSGRFYGGGAAGIGWSTSADGGRSWRSGFLPGLTIFSTPAGALDLVSDPVVGYDAAHGVWMIATLGGSFEAFELMISRSGDGRSWSLPVTAARTETGGFDKEWLVCDNWPQSPYFGRCYLSYLDLVSRQIMTIASSDSGLTWSAPSPSIAAPPNTSVNGAQPVVLGSGALVVVASSLHGPRVQDDALVAVRSTDGGATFSPPVEIAHVEFEEIHELRAPVLSSADVDAAGRIYVVWQDCRFSEECAVMDLVMSTSTDGIAWTAPQRIPTTDPAAQTHSLVPGLGVDHATSGRTTRLAVVHYTMARSCEAGACPGLGVSIISSSDGGRNWGASQRLNAVPMRLDWIPETGLGRMLADYLSVSFVNGRAIPVFTLAAEIELGQFRQAIFARVPPARR